MHKLLFDQNLSYRIVQELDYLFPNSSHVRFLELDQADDFTIWQYARENDFHIVSKDTDFNNISMLNGHPPKVIWIHTGNITTDAIIDLFRRRNESIHTFLHESDSGLLELTTTNYCDLPL